MTRTHEVDQGSNAPQKSLVPEHRQEERQSLGGAGGSPGSSAATFVVLEQRLTAGPQNALETHAAVNPRTPTHAIVASMRNATHAGLTTAVTFDGGRNWQLGSIPPPADSAFNADPMLAIDADGIGYLAMLPVAVSGGNTQTRGVEIYRSLNGGVDWQFMTRMTSGVGQDDKVALTVDTHADSPYFGAIYVAWKLPPGPMYFSRSTDQAMTWTPPAIIPSGGVAGLDLATLPSGRVLLSYNQGFVNPATAKNIQVAVSDDGGDNWNIGHVALTRAAFGVQPAGICQPPGAHVQTALATPTQASPDDERLWVSWTDYLEQVPANCSTACGPSNTCRSGVYTAVSEDGGSTWSPPSRVPGLSEVQGDQYFGWSRQNSDTGELLVSFKDTGSDPARNQAELVLRRSADGVHGEDPEAISGSASAPASMGTWQGDYVGFAAAPDYTYFVWPDYRNRPVGDLYVATRINNHLFIDAFEGN